MAADLGRQPPMCLHVILATLRAASVEAFARAGRPIARPPVPPVNEIRRRTPQEGGTAGLLHDEAERPAAATVGAAHAPKAAVGGTATSSQAARRSQGESGGATKTPPHALGEVARRGPFRGHRVPPPARHRSPKRMCGQRRDNCIVAGGAALSKKIRLAKRASPRFSGPRAWQRRGRRPGRRRWAESCGHLDPCSSVCPGLTTAAEARQRKRPGGALHAVSGGDGHPA